MNTEEKKALCTVDKCDTDALWLGLCRRHYKRARRNGSPTATRRPGPDLPVEERVWLHVNRGSDNECWPWTGHLNERGYGQFRAGKKVVRAHRFVFELVVRQIPAGLEIDHLCQNRACVNPAHLEPVTHEENVARRDMRAQEKVA